MMRPRTSISEEFATVAEESPHATALIYNQEWYTYRELLELSSCLAATLRQKYHVRHGDLVAVALKNSPEWLISLLAIVSIGAVVVPIDGWDMQAFRSLLESHRVRVAFVDKARLFHLDSILNSEKLNGVILCRSPTNGMFPFVDHWRSAVQQSKAVGAELINNTNSNSNSNSNSNNQSLKTKQKTKPASHIEAKGSGVACAVPVFNDQLNRSSTLVEVTHEDWLRVLCDHDFELNCPLTVCTDTAAIITSMSPLSLPPTLSCGALTLFCPVPLLTLLRGETVHIYTTDSDTFTIPNKEIEWSSSWLQFLQQTKENNSVNSVFDGTKRILVVDAMNDAYMKDFADKCEVCLLAHPSVTAATIFYESGNGIDIPLSSLSTEVVGAETTAAATLWGVVLLDGTMGATLPSMSELMSLCASSDTENGLSVQGLVTWQQRSVSTSTRISSSRL